MSFFDRAQRLSRPDSYFAAMNTARGFVSYFPALFDPYRKIVIKGGPGCGKSTLMKKIADKAAADNLEVKRYYCSSDTDSLDAVLLPSLSVVILDGTPPHTVEPTSPGARDSILDLSAFWKKALLREKEDEINALNEKIRLRYTRAYALMSAASSLEEAALAALSQVYDKEKSEKLCERLLLRYRLKEPQTTDLPRKEICPTAAFGVKGRVVLDTFEKQADTVVAVCDRHFLAPFFFATLQTLLDEKRIPYRLSLRPVDEKTESILLPTHRFLITCRPIEAPDVTLNLDRLLIGKGKGVTKEQKALLRQLPPLFALMEKELAEAGRLHDELERYYVNAVDHAALNAFTDELIPALLEGRY